MITSHKNRTHNIKSQYSLSFDGVNEAINIDTALTPLAATTVGTISAWIKTADVTPTASLVYFGFGDTAGTNEVLTGYIRITTGLFEVFCRKANTIQWVLQTNANPFSDNTWAHVVLVSDGVSPVLYVNGASPAQTFTTSTDKTVWFSQLTNLDNGRLACNNSGSAGNASFFPGPIDEVALFNTNFTAAEVLEAYNGGKPTNLNAHSKAANLVAYYRLGDETGVFSTNWQIPNSKSGLENKKSILFDGVNEYISIPHSSDLSFEYTSSFSVSFWVKPAASASGMIYAKREAYVASPPAGMGIGILQDSSQIDFDIFYNPTQRIRTTSPATLSSGTWYHIVATYDGSNDVSGMKVYYNGTSQSLTTVTNSAITTSIINAVATTIGANASLQVPYEGNIDEPRVYNAVLTQAQVTALYNLGSPAEAKDSLTDANLISHWRMGDAPLDTATVIEDVYGSNNGTGVNLESSDLQFSAPLLGVSVNLESTDLSKGAGIV